jgi:hypothetical protein
VSGARKQTSDHKPKAGAQRKSPLEMLRAEMQAQGGLDELAGREVSIAGRTGAKVTVRILDDPLDWEAGVIAAFQGNDFLTAICGMISDEDALLLRKVRPTLGTLMAALMDDGPDGELSLGESQAS